MKNVKKGKNVNEPCGKASNGEFCKRHETSAGLNQSPSTKKAKVLPNPIVVNTQSKNTLSRNS